MINSRDYKTSCQCFRKANNQEINLRFLFCCEKFIKGDVNPKLSHYDKKII